MSTYKHFVMRITQGPVTSETINGVTKSLVSDKLDLIGPFETGKQAADWGATYCSPGGPDDPRWNCVLLDVDSQPPGAVYLPALDQYVLRVRAPRMIDVEPGAYGRSHTLYEDATPKGDGVVGD